MKNYEEIGRNVFLRREKLLAERKERQQAIHRKVTTLVTALAIILTIGAIGVGAAVLSGSDWFAELYKKETHEELSEAQLQYLADNTMDIQQTVTSDGITMTLGAVHSSRSLFDVYIHVVAPEGMSLAGVNLGINHVVTFTKQDGQKLMHNGVSFYYVKDDDGRDNTRTYAFRVNALKKDGEEYNFLQGGPLKMTINGLSYGGMESVASYGEWSFELPFSDREEDEKVIITEPVVVNAYSALKKEYVGKVKITSFTMYNLFGSGTFETVDIETMENYLDVYVNVQVYFKDGTTARANSGWCSKDEVEFMKGKGTGEFEAGFSEPIILSEVDYVVFGGYKDRKGNLIDGVIVDIP